MVAHVRAQDALRASRPTTSSARPARWFPAAEAPSVWDDRAETLDYLEAVR